jgi:hypothetical protein
MRTRSMVDNEPHVLELQLAMAGMQVAVASMEERFQEQNRKLQEQLLKKMQEMLNGATKNKNPMGQCAGRSLVDHDNPSVQEDSSSGDSFWPRSLQFDFPRFHGKDPEGWCYKATQFFEYYPMLDQHKFNLAAFHMEGKALPWFQALRDSNGLSTWCEFLAKFDQKWQQVVPETRKTQENFKDVTEECDQQVQESKNADLLVEIDSVDEPDPVEEMDPVEEIDRVDETEKIPHSIEYEDLPLTQQKIQITYQLYHEFLQPSGLELIFLDSVVAQKFQDGKWFCQGEEKVFDELEDIGARFFKLVMFDLWHRWRWKDRPRDLQEIDVQKASSKLCFGVHDRSFLQLPGQVECCIPKSIGPVNSKYFLGSGYWVFDPRGTIVSCAGRFRRSFLKRLMKLYLIKRQGRGYISIYIEFITCLALELMNKTSV